MPFSTSKVPGHPMPTPTILLSNFWAPIYSLTVSANLRIVISPGSPLIKGKENFS